MKTIAMENGDIALSGGSCTTLSGAYAARQRLVNSLCLDRGSWFLGPDAGISWFDIYNNKSASERMVRAGVTRVLKGDVEVTAVNSIDISFDRGTRTIQVDFSVNTIHGVIEGVI